MGLISLIIFSEAPCYKIFSCLPPQEGKLIRPVSVM
jgi:hypothetical protein